MKKVKYSVLMSVYLKESPMYLDESIESVINQTYKADEIIIVKDGLLTPELDKVIQKYKSNNPELFTIVALEKNLGLGLALNEGLKVARNNLIARMDTDDISLPTRCEKQIKCFMNDKDLSICGTMIDEFKGERKNVFSSRIVPLTNEDILKFSRRRSPFNHVTVMFKKDEVLSTDGGYHDVLRKEDIDLFIRMLNKGYKGKNIDESLVLVRSSDDYYKRRKTWINCKSYIKVIYDFWKEGYSSLGDLIYVTITQLGIFFSPVWLLKFISDNFLRQRV